MMYGVFPSDVIRVALIAGCLSLFASGCREKRDVPPRGTLGVPDLLASAVKIQHGGATIGSGFFLQHRSRGQTNTYLVTAAHVLYQAPESFNKSGQFELTMRRVNDHRALTIAKQVDLRTVMYPRNIDIALMPAFDVKKYEDAGADIRPVVYDADLAQAAVTNLAIRLPKEHFAVLTEGWRKTYQTGVGTDIFLLGVLDGLDAMLFGPAESTVSLRRGSIAAMPVNPVKNKLGERCGRIIVVDGAVMPADSGSPVFARVPGEPDNGLNAHVLGVVKGMLNGREFGAGKFENTGLTAVVPMDEVCALLDKIEAERLYGGMLREGLLSQ